MLDEKTRAAILGLERTGHGKRAIARAFGISRNAVRKVIASGTTEVPVLDRAEKVEPYHDEVVELVTACKGNLVRVHEELEAQGALVSYQAVTAYCRRHGIGHKPPGNCLAGEPVVAGMDLAPPCLRVVEWARA